MVDKQSLYLIGIGGTGARCVEAIVNMASIGLLDRHTIKVVFVDADETNGNLDKAKTRLSNYTRCYKHIFRSSEKCSWMSSQIDLLGDWSPFSKDKPKKLEDLFQYNNLKKQNEGLGNLFDILYTKAERTEYLEEGFLGRPSVGAAFMSKLDIDGKSDKVWADLVEQVKNEASGSSSRVPKILLCGSIFGGTGASGRVHPSYAMSNNAYR